MIGEISREKNSLLAAAWQMPSVSAAQNSIFSEYFCFKKFRYKIYYFSYCRRQFKQRIQAVRFCDLRPIHQYGFTERIDLFFRTEKAHIPSADPYCSFLRSTSVKCCKDLGLNFHSEGTAAIADGTCFSTKTESKWFPKWEPV